MGRWLVPIVAVVCLAVGCSGDDPAPIEVTGPQDQRADDPTEWTEVVAAQWGGVVRCPPGSPVASGEGDLEEYGNGVPREQVDLESLKRVVEDSFVWSRYPSDAPARSAALTAALPPGDVITDVEVGARWPDSEVLGGLYTVTHSYDDIWFVTSDVQCSAFISALETSDPLPAQQLHVYEVQTDCCFREGSLPLIEVLDHAGASVHLDAATTRSEFGDQIEGVFDTISLDPGTYTVSVWQYTCPGSPCSLDPDEWQRQAASTRVAECRLEIDIAPDQWIDLTAVWSVAAGCESITAE